MKLYVANCTRQNFEFHYTYAGAKKVMMQGIRPGTQIEIADLDESKIEQIVRYHGRYGMRQVTDLDRARDYVGLCFNVDAPVPGKKIELALDHNQAVLVERGKAIRQEAAIVANESIAGMLPETSNVNETEATFIEENPEARGHKGVAEGVIVRNDTDIGPKGIQGKKPGRGRA